jgi:hypothetical protein
MNDSTHPARTPGAGHPFTGLVRRSTDGPRRCDECGGHLDPDDDWCPACAQRRRRRAGLETVIDTDLHHRWSTVERSDINDGTTGESLEDPDEPEGWPW